MKCGNKIYNNNNNKKKIGKKDERKTIIIQVQNAFDILVDTNIINGRQIIFS